MFTRRYLSHVLGNAVFFTLRECAVLIRQNLYHRIFGHGFPFVALYDADPAPPAPPPAPAPAPAPPAPPPAPDPAAGVQALIARHNNDLMRVIDHLYGDNFSLREKNRTLKDQVKDLEGKVPGQGSVVLGSDDAKALEAYKALGDLETLKTALGERDKFKGELGVLQREGVLRDVAEAAGFKLPVLKTLAGDDLSFEIKEVEKDGKKARTAFVKNGDGEKDIAEYAKEKWADFLPSLQAQPPAPAGTPYPNQTSGGPPPKSDVLSDFKKSSQDRRQAAPNPLVSSK
jgi:hypothetical protein